MKHHIIAFEDKHGNLDFDRLVEELDKNVELGYINTKTKGDLTLYDYSNTCTYERAWNDATRISRGLVLDKVGGRVVALPFEKFFNEGGEHNEHGRKLGGFVKDGFYEKLDGSCVIIYWYNNEWHINTRGSFDSDQAIKAKEIFDRDINTELLAKEYTFTAEVIYKNNKIVVDYEDRECLVLTGCVVSDHVGKFKHYFGWDCLKLVNQSRSLKDIVQNIGFDYPKRFTFDSIEEAKTLTNSFDHNKEGFVYVSSNGVRVKIKGDEYCRVHGFVSNHTPLFLWRCYTMGGLDACLDRKKDIPEELWEEMDYWLDTFNNNLNFIFCIITAHHQPYKNLSNKELGIAIKNKTIESDWASWFFIYRKDPENFLNYGTKSFTSACKLFEPKFNQIIKLFK